jgi:hypothetical protein
MMARLAGAFVARFVGREALVWRGVSVACAGLSIACASGQEHAADALGVAPVVDAGNAAPPVVPVVGGGDAGPPAESEASGAADERVAKMMKKVARARGLAALRVVPGVILARDALIAKVKAHVDREVPPEAIRHEGLELQILGFIPTQLDYEAETFKLLEAQLAGFYEESDGTMYMAGDLTGENADATLSHELVHALQDQHFDLKSHSKYEAGKSDVQAAFSALAEGDATSAMADVMIAAARPGATALDLPDGLFSAQVSESVSTGPAASAPHIMRTSLVAPYIYGTEFVNAIRHGGGWKAVDAAWAAMPSTSEQILHPDKWRVHEPALTVPAPTFAALGAGWASVDEDTNGELGFELAFEEWMKPELAKKAAAGWGGDRAVLLENGDRAAAAMHLRYDADRVGSDPFPLVADGLAATLGKPAARDASWVCVNRSETGPLGVLKRRHDLVLVAGPATTGPTWASAGTCALAKKWATEIANE